MDYYYNSNKYNKIVFICLMLFLLYFNILVKTEASTINEINRMQKGEIITKLLTPELKNGLKGAQAKILIQAPPEKIWDILSNQENLPEFCPKFKKIKVLEKTDNYQKVEVALKASPLLPLLKYTMTLDTSQKYKKVKFNRIDGCFSKLYGIYELEPCSGGTILNYKMVLDMGFFIPDFICSNGFKKDLPEILSAIKNKVEKS